MPISYKLGQNAKLYYSSDAGSTWTEIDNVENLTLTMDSNRTTISLRSGNGWEGEVATSKKGGVEFDTVFAENDAKFTAMRNAYFDSTTLLFRAMSEAHDQQYSEGLEFEGSVARFSRSEPADGVIKHSIQLTPAINTAPVWRVGPEYTP